MNNAPDGILSRSKTSVMLKNILFPALLLTLVGVLSCHKEEDPKPTYHKQVFSCLMDGERWEPCDYENEWLCWLCPPDPSILVLPFTGTEDTTAFYASFQRQCDSLEQYIWLSVGHINEDLTCGSFFSYTDYNNPCSKADYKVDSNFVLKITRFDSGIVAGSFEGKLIDESCNDTIVITEGKFDLKVR